MFDLVWLGHICLPIAFGIIGIVLDDHIFQNDRPGMLISKTWTNKGQKRIDLKIPV